MNDINPQTFSLLMERFDRLDRNMEDMKSCLAAHATKDEVFYMKVNRHGDYFKVLWAGLAAVGGLMASVWASISPKFFHNLFH